jgi:hypothetical protein
MKKLLTIAFLAILFSSCEKELANNDSNITNLNDVENSIYMIDASGEVQTIQTTEESLVQSTTGSISTRSNENSAHTHGDFSWDAASISVEWSGTENNGGPHGSATYQQVLNLPFPPFNANVQLTLETKCVNVNGNEAVYGGTITDVVDNPFPGGGPFAIGNHLFFKVIDNGQGANAPADQHSTNIFIFPATSNVCLSTDSPLWSFFGGTSIDVVAPGSVKVN